MTPLCELAQKYGTDKFSKHKYTPVYYSMLGDRAHLIERVLEVGIKRGASLRMWEEFFPKATIFGIDHKQRWLINEGRIKSFLGSEANIQFLSDVGKEAGPFDFIVDDASHHSNDQASTAKALLPFLAVDGIYVIEDVKNGPRDNPGKIIINAMPKQYTCELMVTNAEYTDSVLVVIRRREGA